MKVIVAGMTKTGTFSMQFALSTLGYHVYNFWEHFYYVGREWEKIYSAGSSTQDFYNMFKNVDAVAGNPAAYFWDEIYEAFPDAKVILTIRDNEEIWAKSMAKQLEEESSPYILLMSYLSPTFKKFWKFYQLTLRAVYGLNCKYHFSKPSEFNMTLLRMTYRRHNSHVMQTVPRDKLLIFNVKEGWEPLCKFLGKDIPDVDFPHKNIGGQQVQKSLDTRPFFVRAQRETKFVAAAICLLCGVGIYKLVKRSGSFFVKK